MTRRLSLAPQHGEREPAFSYLSRVAARYGVPTRDFAADMGLSFSRIIDGDPRDITALAELTDTEAERLLAWSPKYLGNRNHYFCGHVMHAKAIKESAVRGCPDCLREDLENGSASPEGAVFIRGEWLFRPVTLCAKHHRPLSPLWRAPAKLDRYDIAARMAEIAPAIISGELDLQTRAPADFDLWIAKRLARQSTGIWLDQFPFYPAAHFCELLGRACRSVRFLKSANVPPEDAWKVFQVGFRFAQDGESSIRAALSSLQGLMGDSTDGPKKIFGDLYDRLTFDLTNEDYAPFRTLLRDHIRKTWPLGPGDDLMGEPVLTRHLHSVLTASREYGIDSRRLRKLLVTAGVVRPLEQGRSDAWELFTPEDAEPVLSRLETLLSAADLQDALQISRTHFGSLRKDGYFAPTLEGADHKPLWDLREARGFIDDLLQGAEPVYVPTRSWAHLSDAAIRLKVSPGTIIRLIEGRRLHRVGKHVSRDGFAAILVTLDEVERLLDRPTTPGISIQVFAKQCGLKDIYLRRLVRMGHIPSTEGRNPKTGAKQRFLSTEDIEAFYARFITLRDLAVEHGINWQALRHELAQRGIEPFSPDGEDYGAVFERDTVTL
ncbi:TniQ family protein [Thioclava sp. JE_KL1]|uniref:TniQ family protein n=1 Tax=Thioclava sp. JE_KL1 TaxID=2651187 RepID=UPI00128E011E|nr:TniQ family protein [Thioclava sp. JE_KL1]MPQ94822.1 TniQ family protein [Thioclava sp. JE_KL1]